MVIFENEKIAVKEAEESEIEQVKSEPELADVFDESCRIYTVTGADGVQVGAIAQRRYAEWNMEGIIFATLPEHRRKGCAAEAVRGFTRWFYDNTAENMLIAVVELENVAAVRTLERAGYEYIRTTTLNDADCAARSVFHLFVCSRAVADAGAPPKGCCCGCGGHAE